MGKSDQSVCKWITSVCFFVNKWIKENCLGFHFPFGMAAYIQTQIQIYICIQIQKYIYISISIYMLPFQYIYTYMWKTATSIVCCKQLKEMANFYLFSAQGNQKTEVCFPFLQLIKVNKCLLFQQTCQSMPTSLVLSSQPLKIG